MSIENVPLALVPRANEAQQGASKSKVEGAVDKSPNEFSALLNGMDKEDAPASTESASSSADVDPAAKGQARKKAGSGGKSATDATTTPDAVALMAANQAPAAASVAAPVSDQAATQDGLVVEASVAKDASGAAAAAVNGNSVLQSSTPDARANSVNLANYASVFEQIQSRLAAGGAAADTGQTDSGASGAGAKGSGKPVLGTAAADTRADRMASLAATGSWTMPVMEPSATQAATDAVEALKLAMSERHENTSSEQVKAPEGLGGPHHFTPTVHFESATAVVDVGQPMPEAAVADQVSYWISKGIQNAELTFNGADSHPVEVSISLSGNEAHVEFRSDQADTRDFLTGAASHLKDLLQSEGMVLSGLSVGSSGAGNAGARERRASPDAQQKNIRIATEEVAVRPATSARPSGRAVDLFV
ncbi:flagellar hook-length control protein FliK [Rhodoferax sp.]|uniref:flagellar hook-length control protein FliK n=1 Tax=Rhodoferax sp. TaxID=50421 RepID=UPI00374C92AC